MVKYTTAKAKVEIETDAAFATDKAMEVCFFNDPQYNE